MEEAVVKQGALYLQLQQTFGKVRMRWGRRGASPWRPGVGPLCALPALRFGWVLPRYRAPPAGLKPLSAGHRFPPPRFVPLLGQRGAGLGWALRGSAPCKRRPPLCPAGLEKEFEVMVRATESSERCRLWGRFVLRAGEEALELRDLQTREILYSWPYRFLRRFGRDKVTFSFEAGRRCASGEGNFEFETRQGNEIFQVIESAIEAQRGRGPGGEPHGGGGGGGTAKCLYAQPCNSLHRTAPSGAGKAPEKGRRQDAPAKAAAESEYAVPFDTIAKSLMGRQLGGLLRGPEEAPDPLYDSIHEAGARPPLPRSSAAKPEHIYDEPEGLCTHTVYDEPEEVKGEAWRLQAAPEEPSGHEYPYNPQRDDYAGKEWLGDTEYDNVVLKFAKKRNLQ
uniref:Docking protein 2 n=1 Tax=Anser brachyrhynchus TaxID=132585 RepID=A0A8B9CD89_9AVES